MILEMEYTGDEDFHDDEKQPLDQLQPLAADILKSNNLFMKESSTMYT